MRRSRTHHEIGHRTLVGISKTIWSQRSGMASSSYFGTRNRHFMTLRLGLSMPSSAGIVLHLEQDTLLICFCSVLRVLASVVLFDFLHAYSIGWHRSIPSLLLVHFWVVGNSCIYTRSRPHGNNSGGTSFNSRTPLFFHLHMSFCRTRSLPGQSGACPILRAAAYLLFVRFWYCVLAGKAAGNDTLIEWWHLECECCRSISRQRLGGLRIDEYLWLESKGDLWSSCGLIGALKWWKLAIRGVVGSSPISNCV